MNRQASNTGETEQVQTDGDRVCCSAEHSLSEDELAADVQLLSALGNDTRYEALRLIAGTDSDVCVCELEPALGVSQSAVSQALSRLYSAGLVSRRKDGRWRYYAATPQAERLLDALDDVRGGADA
ncbi:transcriptional regulator, ArsR family [Halogranum rubrum]|uniref:Transcriptional regulator, ArsR family n=1 Tax=Halogranum rubrum TaxID=553466 RepID=A0A1I4BGP0_9EURY|nr:metalloregulator ArsR/SmtB family transcription factor [Halogranum rubrum]SFK68032.1 transcriptional regulator, ArsR family [Halogranum rubrum]